MGPFGLPWAAWGVAATLLIAGAIQTAAFAYFMGGLSTTVGLNARWLKEVAENTKGTRDEVIALKATLTEKVVSAEKEHTGFRAKDEEICERVEALEDRERARLERQGG